MSTSKDELAKTVSGPASMAHPDAPSSSTHQDNAASSSRYPNIVPSQPEGVKRKKKRPRGGKNRRKDRRQSFAAATETDDGMEERPSLLDVPHPRTSAKQASFYRLQSGNRSNASLESEALLDHREHMAGGRGRRGSLQPTGFARPSLAPQARHRDSGTSTQQTHHRSRLAAAQSSAISEDFDEQDTTDRTPLLGTSSRSRSKPEVERNNSGFGYGETGRPRRSSRDSKTSSQRRIKSGSRGGRQATVESDDSDSYDVNNPPSVPGSPNLGGSLDDVMIAELSQSQPSNRGRDAVIDIEPDDRRYSGNSHEMLRRRPTVAELAERDVCFPADAGLSELGEEDEMERRSQIGSSRLKRNRTRQWPDFGVLEEWSAMEKEERTQQEYVRAKKISEPVMVGGRLRPGQTAWHREQEDEPFRFTYFNELLDGTIHARSLSDLLQDGMNFQDLFLPDPVTFSDSEEEGDEIDNALSRPSMAGMLNGRLGHHDRAPTPSEAGGEKHSPSVSKSNTGTNTPAGRDESGTPRPHQKRTSQRHGARPTFWLDILQPTEQEMKVLARAFGIHQLTIEDIQVQEPREKVELFSHYYFVNYRSFEQDRQSEDYMEPVNIYVVVFRDGILSFHHTMTPHPANVRRRIRQLNDYMSPTADWISYAIIDDITDVYAPLVSQIEDEVDQIDDDILHMHQTSADDALVEQSKQGGGKSGKNQSPSSEKDGGNNPSTQGDMGAVKADGDRTAGETGGDMLRRVGECRKRVMGLYRLLGNKADVIKGFAKRCNEHWDVAPRSEIGLYLGDIQDHIVTMTGNLSHYENLLSRAHSNYLAQINIRMNERAEQTADVLGKLTVLGTIVLPMNIITGMWGMNVWVPGQGLEGNLMWFWGITAGLVAFGLTSYFIAKKVYGIV